MVCSHAIGPCSGLCRRFLRHLSACCLGFFSVYFFRYSFVSDRFQYLARIGPLALAGAGIATLLGRFSGTADDFVSYPETVQQWGDTIASPGRRLAISSAQCGILLILLGFLTWRQTAEYHNLFTLYTATFRKKSALLDGALQLGVAPSRQVEADQAIEHYRQAVALRSDYAEAHYLGPALVEIGRLNERNFPIRLSAIEPTEDTSGTKQSRCYVFWRIRHADVSIAHYQKALEIRPDYAEPPVLVPSWLSPKVSSNGAIARYTARVSRSYPTGKKRNTISQALPCAQAAALEYQGPKRCSRCILRALTLMPNLGIAWRHVRDAMAGWTRQSKFPPQNLAAPFSPAWLSRTSHNPTLPKKRIRGGAVG